VLEDIDEDPIVAVATVVGPDIALREANEVEVARRGQRQEACPPFCAWLLG